MFLVFWEIFLTFATISCFFVFSSIYVDLSKLSNVIKNDVVKKDLYNAKIKYIDDKMPDIINLVTETSPNAKINEVKGQYLVLLT